MLTTTAIKVNRGAGCRHGISSAVLKHQHVADEDTAVT